MRYLFRLFRLLIIWPFMIVVISLAMIAYNLLMIFWYFDFSHCKWIDNYWYPISNDKSELKFRDEKDLGSYYWESYEEYYKTPIDLLLDIRTKVIK